MRPPSATAAEPRVFVVDDDDALRDALLQLFDLAGILAEGYADGPSFLAACSEQSRGCVLLDVAMPGMTGIEVHERMRRGGLALPVIFLTGHGDIPMAVRAVQAGAADFLEKPLGGAVLIDRVRKALSDDADRRRSHDLAEEAAARMQRLSPREREVMEMVAAGLSNKEVARRLGLSHRTVEVHRIHVMHKLGVTTLAELVRLSARR